MQIRLLRELAPGYSTPFFSVDGKPETNLPRSVNNRYQSIQGKKSLGLSGVTPDSDTCNGKSIEIWSCIAFENSAHPRRTCYFMPKKRQNQAARYYYRPMKGGGLKNF
jgi:hypothetical protein